MKSLASFPSVARAAFCLALTVAAFAQTPANPPPKIAAADLAWIDLQAAMFTEDFSKGLPAEPAALRAALTQRAVWFAAAADQAKKFYTEFPDHARAHDARRQEIQALVSASQMGDAMAEGRLIATVAAVRDDKKIPANIRVQAVAAYSFSTEVRKAKGREERLKAIERVARGLMASFPDQPQGFESLLTVAHASDDVAAAKVARELLASPSPAAVKEGAQTLLGRMDLVGKSLAAELVGAGIETGRSALAVGRPTVIYTWATWSSGSLALAADLKKRALAVNLIGLNLDSDTKAAELLAQKEQLPGLLLYDDRGAGGALAQRLKVRTAPQLILVDAQGKIREARAEADLEKKLKQFGL